MNIKLTFSEWLILIGNPLTRIRITTYDGRIFEGKKSEGLNFKMSIVGFDIGHLVK